MDVAVLEQTACHRTGFALVTSLTKGGWRELIRAGVEATPRQGPPAVTVVGAVRRRLGPLNHMRFKGITSCSEAPDGEERKDRATLCSPPVYHADGDCRYGLYESARKSRTELLLPVATMISLVCTIQPLMIYSRC